MVASRQVVIPFFGGTGRQREREFGAPAQVFGKTAVPFLLEYILPAAKRVSADLWELSVQELEDVVSGRKKFNTAAESVGRQTLRKYLDSCNRKTSASRVIPTKSAQQHVGQEEKFLQTFLIFRVEKFSIPTFCGSSGNFGRSVLVVVNVLSSQEQEIYSTTSLIEKTAYNLNFKRIGTIKLI